MSSFWMAGRKPCMITSCMRYIIIFKESGNVPVYAPCFGQLTNVTEIQLDGNDLTGSIPESIGQLKALKLLSLSANHLNGSIPESIGQLTGLT